MPPTMDTPQPHGFVEEIKFHELQCQEVGDIGEKPCNLNFLWCCFCEFYCSLILLVSIHVCRLLEKVLLGW